MATRRDAFARMRADRQRERSAEYERRSLQSYAAPGGGTLDPYNVYVTHDGQKTTWVRCARSRDEARRSGLAAAHREYPGQKIRISVAPRGR